LTIFVVTVYTATIGTPLYCDGWDTDYLYSPDTPPWVAWPFDSAGGRCGDHIAIWIDGERYDYLALDSGAFGHHCVLDAEGCHPIAADVPVHLAPFEGLSHRAERVINVSERRRRRKREPR
jgi:hypothetical protein